jgi:hypothetical protein
MWSKERSWEWYNNQPWIFGFNYLPSNAVNSTAMWQKEVFDEALVERELRAAADIGYNACRVFLQYILWEDNEEELMEELKKYDSDDIYIIGGESIYNQFVDKCDLAYITKIDYEYEADAHFPNLDEKPNWKLVKLAEEETYFDVIYHFSIYQNQDLAKS